MTYDPRRALGPAPLVADYRCSAPSGSPYPNCGLAKSKIDFLDDGPEKPVRIWSRTGRRPMVAGGNSNGDIPVLRFARGADRDALRLQVLHDDPDREFHSVAGAEDALERAKDRSWSVVSVKTDWDRVFPRNLSSGK